MKTIFHKQKIENFELFSGGYLTSDLSSLHNELAPQTYVYIIFGKDQVVLGNRFSGEKDFLLTHRSLFNYAKTKYNIKKEDIKAAGEIITIFNKVSIVNNKSGTFRGKISNLRYALELFKDKNLQVKGHTKIIDYSNIKSLNHNSVQQIVSQRAKVESSQEIKKIEHKLLEIYRQFVKIVPDESNNGFAIKSGFMKKVENHDNLCDNLDEISFTISFLSEVSETKSFSTIAMRVYNEELGPIESSINSLEKSLKMIEEISE
jgi:hypothetical protein